MLGFTWQEKSKELNLVQEDPGESEGPKWMIDLLLHVDIKVGQKLRCSYVALFVLQAEARHS